jgi:Zn-dependent peptidase ImmA (M78 family)
MELADCFTPEALAKEIFRQCPKLTPPIPIADIAKAVGIVEIIEKDLSDIGGMLVSDEEKNEGVIFHHSEGPSGRKRFTIAHELGHFLLPKHSATHSCFQSDIKIGNQSNKNNVLEAEANQFAQSLLMPAKFISSAINQSLPDIHLLISLKELFGMSFEAISNECTKHSKHPFALVYSRNGIIRYCWRHWSSFEPRIIVKSGEPLPQKSHASQLNLPNETVSLIKDTVPEMWLGEDNSHIALQEQSYIQSDGYMVTLLRFTNT